MQISLQILKERLNLEENELSLDIKNPCFYTKIVFLTEDTKVMKNNILYFSTEALNKDIEFENETGIVSIFPIDNLKINTIIINSTLSISQLFNRIANVFETFCRFNEKLMIAVYQERSIEKVISIVSEVLGNPSYLVDNSFKVLAIDNSEEMTEMSATWKHLTEYGYMPFDIVYNLIESKELSSMEMSMNSDIIVSKFFYTKFINYNLRHKGKIQGHLFIAEFKKKITKGDIELANYCGNIVLETLMSNQDFFVTRGRNYEHFIIDMIEGKLQDKELIARQMTFLDFKLDDLFYVVKIKLVNSDEKAVELAASYLEKHQGLNPVVYQNAIIIIIPNRKNVDITHIQFNMKKFLKKLESKIGLSDKFTDFWNLQKYYKQANIAINLGDKFNRNIDIYAYKEYALRHLLSESENIIDLKTICCQEIFAIDKYDKEHDTELLNSLECYIMNERNLILTSKKLFIHRNTLSYRLAKINELFNLNLDDLNIRNRLYISFIIYRFLNS